MTHPPWRPWYGVVSGPGNCLYFNVVSLVLSGLMAPKRRSTIEVHPSFSEAPHLRSSVPRPKTGSSKNQNASRRIIPWPKSTKRFFFRNQDRHTDDLGSRSPVFQKQIAEMCYLYRITGPKRNRTRQNIAYTVGVYVGCGLLHSYETLQCVGKSSCSRVEIFVLFRICTLKLHLLGLLHS